MSSPATDSIVYDGNNEVSFVDPLITNQYGTNEGIFTEFQLLQLGGFDQYGTNTQLFEQYPELIKHIQATIS